MSVVPREPQGKESIVHTIHVMYTPTWEDSMHPTLAGRVADRVARDYILSGQLSEGERLPSIRRLVEEYGASLATVAQALGLLEERGIVTKRAGSGCYVGPGGRDGAQPKLPRLLGLVGPPFEQSEVSTRLLAGVQRAAHRHGCQLLVASHSSGYKRERDHIAQMLAGGCEAIILSPCQRTPEDVEHDYLIHDFPEACIIIVDMGLPEQGRIQVLFDNFAAGYEMACYLIRQGHRHIAFVRAHHGGKRYLWRSVEDRQLGYLLALREHGIVPRPQDSWLLELNSTWADAEGTPCADIHEKLRWWREQPERPTAVMGHSDDFTVPAIKAARELGIDVPDELIITGFDNLAIGTFITPPFPTTRADFELAGEKAVQLALQHAHGNVPDQTTYVLPVPLVLRDEFHKPAFQPRQAAERVR